MSKYGVYQSLCTCLHELKGYKLIPGVCVAFSGIVWQRWRNASSDCRCDVELVFRANHVLVTNEQKTNVLLTREQVTPGESFESVSADILHTHFINFEQRDEFEMFWSQHGSSPLHGRNHIIASLCPQVFGLYVVKLAVALVMSGGVRVRTSFIPP